MWQPQIEFEAHDGPLYRAITEALARDVQERRLRVGERLPTHRDLAQRLGVNVGTVTRAYAEAARRGLVEGEVGRGTFVRAQRRLEPLPLAPDTADCIDLSFNVPTGGAPREVQAATLKAIARENDLTPLFDRYQGLGLPRHREAGARWMERSGLATDPEHVAVVGGAQHAMAVCLTVLVEAGDLVVTEWVTYPGIKSLASALGFRLAGLDMDSEGLLPEAFEAACATSQPRLLYLMSSVQNPTGIVTTEERRRALAAIAREHGVPVLEDDTYGFLAADAPPPLAHFAPELTYFVTSASKSLAAGLRVGWIHLPESSPRATEKIVAAVGAVGWMTAPLSAEIAARWIEDGTAARIVGKKRSEARARRRLAEERLGPLDTPSDPSSCHVWWNLPDPWRSDELAAQARAAGVAVSPPEPFVVGRRALPHAVRLCLGTPETRAELVTALDALAGVAGRRPEPRAAIV